MASNPRYSISRAVRFRPLKLIDIRKLHEACHEAWFKQRLSQVNESVVRLGVIQGESHWHKHDSEDEFFYVVTGGFS